MERADDIDLAAVLSALVGRDATRSASESRAVRLGTGPDAPMAFFRRHLSARKYRQEVAALTAWAPALSPRAPRLLARDDATLGLLTTAVAGDPLEGLRLVPSQERTAYRDLGALTKRLHEITLGDAAFSDEDPVAPAAAYRLRVASWCEMAAGYVEAELVANVRAYALEAAPALADARRVPCHRDIAPRNVLVDARGNARAPGFTVGLVDFEHARADLPWFDLVRLAAEAWPEEPERKAAFLDGYGGVPTGTTGRSERPAGRWTDADEGILARLVALHALATTAWAARHHDARLETEGRRSLERLRFEA